MNNGSLILKKINILGSKANELISKNKLLSMGISYYQQLFSSNKNYITLYFNILSQNKKNSKNKFNNDSNNINNIKDIIIKYHSELKDHCITSKQQLKDIKQKYNIYLSKLISGTKSLSEYYEKISEDNFLYANAIILKENFILCLKKDLESCKIKLFEDVKHIYLKYNSNIYQTTNQTQINTKNKNDSASFEEGENEIKELLRKERQQFVIKMKLRNDIRLKYSKMNVKKTALNDLVTSISFINNTEIIPSQNKNIFQVLNKRIGGAIKNYEKYFNDDEIIDENYFIFLPFEIEINKAEISELIQTDITLPNKKLQSKSINEYKISNKKHAKSRSFINVPKLNFLQIEFNKEKISYSNSESGENKENNDEKNNENSINNNDKQLDNTLVNNKKSNKEDINLQIKKMKKDIKYYKKQNKKMKGIIKDFEKFQKKIKDKFIIFEKMMLNKNKKDFDYLKEK